MDAALDTDAGMHARHARLLGRLAELGMALAEDQHARSLAAETTEEAAQAAAGFHRLSRSVRQSLEARLRRDAARAVREVEVQAEREAAEAPVRRRAEVTAALERLVWTEAEDIETGKFWDEGVRRLVAHAQYTEGFAERPAGEVIAELSATLRDTARPAPRGPGEREEVVFTWAFVDAPDYKWEPPDTG